MATSSSTWRPHRLWRFAKAIELCQLPRSATRPAGSFVAPHQAATEHRAVPDVAVRLHEHLRAGKAVEHAAVLHVRACLQHDLAEVAAQRSTRTDIAAGADDHVADQDGGGMHVGAGVDDGHQGVDGIAGDGADLQRPGYFAYLRKSGLRFSFNALTPSGDSSVS
jgi:hypothetical protein